MESYEQIPETAREAEPGNAPRDEDPLTGPEVTAPQEVPGEGERPTTVDPDRDPEAADPSVGGREGTNLPREIQAGL